MVRPKGFHNVESHLVSICVDVRTTGGTELEYTYEIDLRVVNNNSIYDFTACVSSCRFFCISCTNISMFSLFLPIVSSSFARFPLR